MIKFNHTRILLLSVLGALGLLCSCQREVMPSDLELGGDPVTMSLSFPMGTLATRATGDLVADSADESRISMIDIYAFKHSNGNLVNSVHKSVAAGYSEPLTVSIEVGRAATDFYIVANAPDGFRLDGTSRDDLLASVSNYADNRMGYFVMTGKSLNVTPTDGLTVPVTLERVCNKIEVMKITKNFDNAELQAKRVVLRDIRLVNVTKSVTYFGSPDPAPTQTDASFINARAFESMISSLYGRKVAHEASETGTAMDESLYFYPNASPEAADIRSEDYVTKLVFSVEIDGTLYRYPIGIPQTLGQNNRNLLYRIDNLNIYMKGNPEGDSPNKYISPAVASISLSVLDWDLAYVGGSVLPVWESVFEVTGVAIEGTSGSSTGAVTSWCSSLISDIPLRWHAEYSADNGASWSTDIPGWLTVSPASSTGAVRSSEPVTVSWDMSYQSAGEVRYGRLRLIQDRTERDADWRVSSLFFAGTATPGTNMGVRIINDAGTLVRTVSVHVDENGVFGAALPELNSGQRYSFEQCPVVTVTSLPDQIRKGNGTLEGTFRNCSRLQSVCVFDSSNATSFAEMFYGCSALQAGPAIETRNATDLHGMFRGCSNLTYVPLYNTKGATDFSYFLSGCVHLTSLPHFNTISAVNFSHALENCRALGSTPHFDLSSVTNMDYAFAGSGIVISEFWDTRSCVTARGAFKGCSSLFQTRRFVSSNLVDVTEMFDGCTSLYEFGSMTYLSAPVTLDLSSCSVINNIKTFIADLGVAAGPDAKIILPLGKEYIMQNHWDVVNTKGWTVIFQ